MYEDRLGTDWTDISDEEAIRRAYALGVAAAFGYENREEFDRLRAALDTSYDRSIIDLAYQEGTQEARVVHAESDTDDGAAVWAQLVGGAIVAAQRRRRRRVPRPRGPSDHRDRVPGRAPPGGAARRRRGPRRAGVPRPPRALPGRRRRRRGP
ncbi:hypothetical protein ACFQRB_03585 [Halobaculum litoreum]|uniref:Uncharacterized protein n=1 Tax=Halobaculum litoreum TaxID=3031998 RepID=A0ABD5XQK4_9EURY